MFKIFLFPIVHIDQIESDTENEAAGMCLRVHNCFNIQTQTSNSRRYINSHSIRSALFCNVGFILELSVKRVINGVNANQINGVKFFVARLTQLLFYFFSLAQNKEAVA